jgi:ubiquitin-like-conjugating enzyme ATG3
LLPVLGQHAAAMLKIISALTAAEKVPKVEQYLFIFLKFMQSVIPTIEYDFTSEVDVMMTG